MAEISAENWLAAKEQAGKTLSSLETADRRLHELNTTLEEAHTETPQPWLEEKLSTIEALPHITTIGEGIEKVNKNLDEHTPPGVGMTTSEKSYCHGRVTYIKSHLDKLEATATRAPSVLTESTKVRTQLETLSTRITLDPRARHLSPPNRRGLTVRQRRRLRS